MYQVIQLEEEKNHNENYSHLFVSVLCNTVPIVVGRTNVLLHLFASYTVVLWQS